MFAKREGRLLRSYALSLQRAYLRPIYGLRFCSTTSQTEPPLTSKKLKRKAPGHWWSIQNKRTLLESIGKELGIKEVGLLGCSYLLIINA